MMDIDKFLAAIDQSIRREDPFSLMEIIANGRQISLDENSIIRFFSNLSTVSKRKFDIHISGQGGSGIKKPNLTSLTAYYLALCGYDVVKTGSTYRTNLNGSSDFFQRMQQNFPDLYYDMPLTYYDLNSTSPWLKYQTILCYHPDFENFFRTFIYDEVLSNVKYTGILGPDVLDNRVCKKHTNIETRENIFYSKVSGQWVDEIMPDQLYLNGKHLPIAYAQTFENSEINIEEMNDNLLLGNDQSSYWYHCLKLSVSIIVSWHSNWNIPHFEAERMFENAYRRL